MDFRLSDIVSNVQWSCCSVLTTSFLHELFLVKLAQKSFAKAFFFFGFYDCLVSNWEILIHWNVNNTSRKFQLDFLHISKDFSYFLSPEILFL